MSKLVDFTNKTVFILGGGPSLLNDDQLGLLEGHLENQKIHKRRVIAINESIYCALYADILFFRDIAWYFGNREIVETWDGVVVTTTPSRFYNENENCTNVNIVQLKHSSDFLIGGDTIRYGRSSGHLALSLAINLGAKRCVLLGFDCRFVDGRSHFHSENNRTTALTYSSDFLPAWNGWGDAARRAGVEVVNATPNSAIIEFPYKPLAEVL